MHIAHETIRRLPRYLMALESLKSNGHKHVSSFLLADHVNESAIKIRHDLNQFGHFGQKGTGYDVDGLRHTLIHILGADRPYSAIVIGGNGLESSLLQSWGLAGAVQAVFQIPSEAASGMSATADRILSEAAAFTRQNHTDVVILAAPGACARKCAARLENTGIRGILNLTGVELAMGSPILVESLDLADSLLSLACRLRDRDRAMEASLETNLYDVGSSSRLR